MIYACGTNSYVMAIDKEGNLFTWGCNAFGKLGNGKVSTFKVIGTCEWDFQHVFDQDNSVLIPTKIMNVF